MKQRNYVHKHALKYNKACTHIDKKKQTKQGYNKHKNSGYDTCSLHTVNIYHSLKHIA